MQTLIANILSWAGILKILMRSTKFNSAPSLTNIGRGVAES